MTLRISLLIPLLLAIATIGSSAFVYFSTKESAEENIRKEALSRIKLDITRLQNVLYNTLTEKDNKLQDARLNLSVTAMEPLIKTLVLTDENNKIILSSRYAHEGSNAKTILEGFEPLIAQETKDKNIPHVHFLEENNKMLHGYYPVVLNLENFSGTSNKHLGILFVEVDITNKLNIAFQESASTSFKFACVMLIVALFLALLLHKLVSRRLIRLSQASEQLAAGQLDTQVNIHGRDELALLGKAFDKMALQIKNDIGLRKKAEEELRQLTETLEHRVEERTKLLNEAQSIGHLGNWSWNISTDELYWSDEIYKIYGYQPKEIEPTYDLFISTFHPEDFDYIKSSGDVSIAGGGHYSLDHRITLPSGEERWVHEEIIADEIMDGKPVILSGTIQDITERKIIETNLVAAKEEAERLSEIKSEFLSRMSHELRTPMNAILGFSQLLNMESMTDKQHSFVDEINTAGDHLLSLISDLLDLSRIESGHTLVVLESIKLKDVLDEAIKLTDPVMTEYNITLNLNSHSDFNVIADGTRLRQVLVNLLSNASKYNKKGGVIDIDSQVNDDVIRLSITDQGDGIDPNKVEKLFIPFERLGAERTGIDGTGIGLSLSKQLVELMNGEIGVDSKQWHGSTFWIELPLAKSSSEPLSVNGDSEASDGESKVIRNILYIEDKLPNIHIVEGMLENFEQLKLITAHNGKYGIELAQEYNPDLILLDINLPDIDGYQVLKELKDGQVTRNTPVVAFSSNAMPLDIKRGQDAGFNDYLAKPVKLEELINVVNRFSHVTKSQASE